MDIKSFAGKYARAKNGDVYKFGKLEQADDRACIYSSKLDYVLANDRTVQPAARPHREGFGIYTLSYSVFSDGLVIITREEFLKELAKAVRRQAHFAVKAQGSAFYLQFKSTHERRALLAEMIREVQGDV